MGGNFKTGLMHTYTPQEEEHTYRTDTEFNNPVFQNTQATPDSQALQSQAPELRQGSSANNLYNMIRANQNTEQLNRTAGSLGRALSGQTEFQQKQIQDLAKNPTLNSVEKGLSNVQNMVNLQSGLGTSSGVSSFMKKALNNPNRLGNKMDMAFLKQNPALLASIQKQATAGLNNTLGNLNQLAGGFKYKHYDNGNLFGTEDVFNKINVNLGPNKDPNELLREQGDAEDLVEEYEEDEGDGEEEASPNKFQKAYIKGSELYDKAGKQLQSGINRFKSVESSGEKALKKAGTGTENLIKSIVPNVVRQPTQMVARKAENEAKNVARRFGGAIGGAFNTARDIVSKVCHSYDTKIILEDGMITTIEKLKVGDSILKGGKISQIESHISNDTYSYKGIKVTGSHSVQEDSKWIRVKDSRISKFLGEDLLVFSLINKNHFIVTSDGTVWKDYEELDNSDKLSDDEILDILNR